MVYLSLHPAIAHLEQEEIDDLIEAYIAGTIIADLLNQFKIKIAPNQLQKILPHKSINRLCPVCNKNLIQNAPKRYGKAVREREIHCINCGHTLNNRCRCQQCISDRQNQEIEDLKINDPELIDVLAYGQINCYSKNYSLADLPLEVAVSFLAFVRCCPVDFEDICGPLENNDVPLAPKELEFENEQLELLQKFGLIALSHQSSKESITIDGDLLSYQPQNVRWLVAPYCSRELIKEIELAGLTGQWPDHWYKEAQPFWNKLALSECRQYYEYCATMRGLKPQGERAVNEMLENLLRDFSVGQAFRCIWHGAISASDFLTTKKVSKAHAANFMVGATQRWADRARSEGWQVKPFKRNFDLPRSMISYVLFDVILNIGERGFTKIIYKENLG